MNVKISFVVFVMSLVMMHGSPIDILSQLTDSSDRELLYRIAEYLSNDYSDDSSSYSSAVQTRGVTERMEQCRLPMKRGLCRALLPRWRYDPVAKKCIEFKFGG
jgi:tissue factor pathway inhibitor 2